MSFVTAQPESLAAAAGQLHGIGIAMNARNVAVSAPTTGSILAAADEVSALTATQFAAHAAVHQGVSPQAVAVQDLFVPVLGASAESYAATEASNTVAAG